MTEMNDVSEEELLPLRFNAYMVDTIEKGAKEVVEKFQNIEIGYIYTHSHKRNSPSYVYIFRNYGFDNYEFIGKYPTADRR